MKVKDLKEQVLDIMAEEQWSDQEALERVLRFVVSVGMISPLLSCLQGARKTWMVKASDASGVAFFGDSRAECDAYVRGAIDHADRLVSDYQVIERFPPSAVAKED